MAIDSGKVLTEGVKLTTTLTALFPAVATPLLRVKIDSVTVTNFSNVNASLTAEIIPSGGSAGDATQLIDSRPIRAGESYLCPELIGQAVVTGGTLQMLASVNDRLNVRITGTFYSSDS